MRISTKANYGLRLLLQLAKNNKGESLQLKEIAKREDLSVKYLEKVVQVLKQANLVKVTRGAKGGYRLDRSPDKIILKDVYTALEGTLNITDDFEKVSGYTLWEGLSDVITAYLESQSLEDLVIAESGYNMFYI